MKVEEILTLTTTMLSVTQRVDSKIQVTIQKAGLGRCREVEGGECVGGITCPRVTGA